MAKESSSMTSMTGQTTVVELRAIRSSRGSSHPFFWLIDHFNGFDFDFGFGFVLDKMGRKCFRIVGGFQFEIESNLLFLFQWKTRRDFPLFFKASLSFPPIKQNTYCCVIIIIIINSSSSRRYDSYERLPLDWIRLSKSTMSKDTTRKAIITR